MHTIQSICVEAGITPPTFYRLRKENPDFDQIARNGSEKHGKKILYSDAVVDWLKHRHITEASEAADASETNAAEGRQQPEQQPDVDAVAEVETLRQQLADLRETLEAVQRDRDAWRDQLQNANAEKGELLKTQAHLLLLLSQEKAEKERLLPAAPEASEPRRSWWGRMFGSRKASD